MSTQHLTMCHFSTKQFPLFYCYTLPEEQKAKLNLFLEILDTSTVGEIIEKAAQEQNLGRPGIDPYAMFATILFGFAFNSPTLRDLETSCRFDIRYKYLMGLAEPTYSTFSRFINKVIKPNCDEIFALVTAAYLKHCKLDFDECHIDGTKFEAKPNKYKFVWKPTTFHKKLSAKTLALLRNMGISGGVPENSIIHSDIVRMKLTEAGALPIPTDPKEAKALREKISNLSGYLLKTLEYEEKERICGPNRNSYYKTDHDATAMCLKQDYYSGLGSHMHAAYQMQCIVSHGFVVTYYVSQDRTDLYTFIPTLDKHFRLYGKYPSRITADSGYGCLDNYKYCQEHGIEAYIKYVTWQGECSGRRPALFELEEDDSITCIWNQKGYQVEIPERHHKVANGKFYRVSCPRNCEYMTYCRQFHKERVASERIFEISPEYQRLKQKARDRLLSVKGIEMRVNRSCQIEGVYGITKYDMSYSRIRRVGMNQVVVEYMLTVLGLNTRKLFRFLSGKTCLSYWVPPPNIEPEKLKKPSAKRLTRSVLKKKAKSVNEVARGSARYKKCTK